MATHTPRKEEVSLEVEAVQLEVRDDWIALYQVCKRKKETRYSTERPGSPAATSSLSIDWSWWPRLVLVHLA